MMRHRSLEHRFARTVPRELEPGVLYVSMEYATAVHDCCCGCGERVVTPFTPTDWKMTFDGDSVSLHPSIGNWQSRCQSHYVIHQGRVLQAGPWTGSQVAAELRRDKVAKRRHYTRIEDGASPSLNNEVSRVLAVDRPIQAVGRESRRRLRSVLAAWARTIRDHLS